MKTIKTISVAAVSGLAGLFVGQARVALSKPKLQKPVASTLYSSTYAIGTAHGRKYGGMGGSRNNGGIFFLADPTSKVASVQEIANPPAITLFQRSSRGPAFIRFAFAKDPKTHVISPVIQMMDSTGKASEMDENGKVRSIKQPNPKTWWTPEH